MASIGEGMRHFIDGADDPVRHHADLDQSRQDRDRRRAGNARRQHAQADARRRARVEPPPGGREHAADRVRLGASSSYGGRGRRVYVYGVTSEAPRVWSWKISIGQNIPEMDWDRGSAVAVLGAARQARAVRRVEPARRRRPDRASAFSRDRRDGAQGPVPGLRSRRFGLHSGSERACACSISPSSARSICWRPHRTPSILWPNARRGLAARAARRP